MRSRPEDNPHNELREFLHEIGLKGQQALEIDTPPVGEQTFQASVSVTLPSGERVSAMGDECLGKKTARKSACRALLTQLQASHAHLFQSWDALYVEAQAGDVLIKLAAYRAQGLSSASAASRLLQKRESNAHLAVVFDRWRAAGDADLREWGTHLSKHRKGTLVEALIWRRFSPLVIKEDAGPQLARLLEQLAL